MFVQAGNFNIYKGVMCGGFVGNIINKAIIRFLYIKIFTPTQNLIITS